MKPKQRAQSQVNTNYETVRVAVNLVLFTIRDGALWVHLTIREKAPFKELRELPGGLLITNETAESTMKRKVSASLQFEALMIQQFHTFTNPDRDPRIRTISIGYIALLPTEMITEWKDFFDTTNLPALAFDHQEIIERARTYLQKNASDQFVKQLVPEQFPLNQLQRVYEVLLDETLDNRNFRKKMLASGAIKKAGQKQKNVTHRPATLFKFVG